MCQERAERGTDKRRYHDACRQTAARWRKQRRRELDLHGRSEPYGCVACGLALPDPATQDGRSNHWFCSFSCRDWWHEKRAGREAWHAARATVIDV